jgi:hypothetical protein
MNNMSFLAPIALFVYNRLDHAVETVEALKNNQLASESDLFIFSDAAVIPSKQEAVKQVREFLKSVKGFKSIKIIYQEKNLGLSASIITGVSEMVSRYGKIIVLEDDMVTSPYFLKYMNEALNLYQEDDKVISIHAYMYPVKLHLPDTFFLQGADCWGWATWKRGWDLFEGDGKKLLSELKKRRLTTLFDFNNSYPYTKMLEDQIEGKVDSWAIRWYASAFLKGKYTLYPGQSLLSNIGVDGSGMHCEPDENYSAQVNPHPVNIVKITVAPDKKAMKAISEFFKPKQNRGIRIKDIFKKLFKGIYN